MKKSFVLFILMFFTLTSCQSLRGEGEKVIGVSLLTQSHSFQSALKDSIEKEAVKEKVGIEITIAEQDLKRQIPAIEQYIEKKVDAIIVVPVDSKGISEVLNKAKDANIPVITVDIKAKDVEVDSHVGTDNYMGGFIAAEVMNRLLPEGGDVGLLTYPEVQSVQDRIAGFKEGVKTHPNLKIKAEFPGRTAEEAKKASEKMITEDADMKGVFGFGDDMSLAATAVILERDLDTIVVGFDGLEQAKKTVEKNNPFKAVVVHFPEKMGEAAMQNAIKIMEGKEGEKEVLIRPGLFIQEKGMVEVKIEDGKVMIKE